MQKTIRFFLAAVLITIGSTFTHAQGLTEDEAKAAVKKERDAEAQRNTARRQGFGSIDGITDTTPFKFTGTPSLTFSQAQYSESWLNGSNSLGFRAAFIARAVYVHNRILFSNSLDLAYARSKEGDADYFSIKEDRLNFNSSFGYSITPTSPFFYVGQIDLKTQFDKGYNADHTLATSKFFAPAYLVASLGVSYKTEFGLSALLAPISGRFTFVTDTAYSKFVANMQKDDGTNRKAYAEFGAYAEISYVKDVTSWLSINSKLDLFSNYQDNPQNIDIDWTNTINFKINKFLSAIFFARIIYRDKDRYYKQMPDGSFEVRRSNWQWTESLNIGLVYSF